MSQEQQILNHLKRKPITALDAMQYGCMRLAARIKDLRDKGHPFFSQTVRQNGKQFAKYYLIKKGNKK